MSINQKIVLQPNQPGKTPITGANLAYLKNNISKLNLIYNSIFKHICANSLNSSHDILQNIKTDLSLNGINPNVEFCYDNISGISGISSPECVDGLFKDHHLINTINQLKANNVTKICVYKQLTQTTNRVLLSSLVPFSSYNNVYLNQPLIRSSNIVNKPTTINTNVQVIGGALSESSYNTSETSYDTSETFDNASQTSVRKLLINDMSNMSNMSRHNYINLEKIMAEQNEICINIGGKKICTIREKKHNCTLCKKWEIERKQFKKAIMEMIILDNYLDIFNIMCKSAVYLPAAILDQDKYNSYYENLNEFKALKKNAAY